MVKPVVLKVNGVAFSLRTVTESEKKLIDFFSRAPADDVFLPESLPRATGISRNVIDRHFRSGNLSADFTAKVGKRRYYGNPKAIAELKRQAGQ